MLISCIQGIYHHTAANGAVLSQAAGSANQLVAFILGTALVVLNNVTFIWCGTDAVVQRV